MTVQKQVLRYLWITLQQQECRHYKKRKKKRQKDGNREKMQYGLKKAKYMTKGKTEEVDTYITQKQY